MNDTDICRTCGKDCERSELCIVTGECADCDAYYGRSNLFDSVDVNTDDPEDL